MGRHGDLYSAFRVARNTAFAFHPINQGESNIEYALRLGRICMEHKRSGDDTDKAFEAARDAGRKCLTNVFEPYSRWLDYEMHAISSLRSYGFAQLFNVYVITSVLDAVNWAVMHSALSPAFENWADVFIMNILGQDKIYEHFFIAFKEYEASNSPFPDNDVTEIQRHITAARQKGLFHAKSAAPFESVMTSLF